MAENPRLRIPTALSLAALTLCLTAPLACDKPSEGEGEPAEEASRNEGGDDTEREDKDDAIANPFAGMANNPFAALLGKKLSEPGPYDPPKQSDGFDADEPHLRVLTLKGSVAEVEGVDPLTMVLGGGGSTLQTRALLDELDELAAEDTVRGLVLRVGNLGMDMARAEELRAGLLEFKATERSLYCHAETLDNASYYLLSACDELSMAPVGTVAIPGPIATPIHLKGLLDKLGVQPDFLHVGAFKGAAEPLTRDAPSPEMIETLEAVIDKAHGTMVEGIASGRKRSPEEVSAWIDEALYTTEKAKQAGLIDRVDVWEGYLAEATDAAGTDAGLETPLGWKKASVGAEASDMLDDPMALQRFIGLAPPKRPTEPHVAIVYAVGNIIDGKGQGALGATSEIASGQLVPVLDRIAADDAVAAVVLRVDSGGGSALASEQIWHAVERLKANKPVVVSMAGVAASGGYYISAGANHIVAEPNTLTGSIGVVGGKLAMGEALSRWGVETFTVKKGARANLWSPMDTWTEEERAAIYATMEETYEVFLSRVAAGRSMDRDGVHAIAQGRVWTGADAKERGLVDELGGIEVALAKAAELGNVEGEPGYEVYPGEPTLKDLLGSFGGAAGMAQASAGTRLPMSAQLMLDELALGLGDAPGAQAWLGAVERSLSTLFHLQGTTLWCVEWIAPPR